MQISALSGEFSSEEISLIVRIVQKYGDTVNEHAVQDYIEVIRREAEKRGSNDLMTAWNRRRNG